MEFSRPDYWTGSPIPSPADLPDLGIELGSPELQVDSLPSELSGKPLFCLLSSFVTYLTIYMQMIPMAGPTPVLKRPQPH